MAGAAGGATPSFALPPLMGGHQAAPPPPEPFDELFAPPIPMPPSPTSRQGPSSRAKQPSRFPPPADGTLFADAQGWITAEFDRRHALLQPVLRHYLETGGGGSSSSGGSGRVKSLASFLHAFYVKEKLCAPRAVAAAAEFLNMESWRARWLEQQRRAPGDDALPGLPKERRAQRDAMDPLLKAAATAVAARPEQLHRESVEFAASVVAEASRARRVRLRAKEEERAAGAGVARGVADDHGGPRQKREGEAPDDQQRARRQRC